MARNLAATFTVLHGEEAAAELAADMRRFSVLPPSSLGLEQGAVVDPATLAAIASAIIAAGSLTAQVATLPGSPASAPAEEVRDELTVVLQNSSGLLLVPVRHESDRGDLLVAEPGSPLRGAAATRVVALTTGLARANLRLTLLIGDARQSNLLRLTLDRTPGDGEDRGWRFSEVSAPQDEPVALPTTGNREVVAVLVGAGLGELSYALYLRGCQSNTGAANLLLFDRTEPESGLVGGEPAVDQEETPAQLVRITSVTLGSSGRKRYLYDQDGQLIVKTFDQAGNDASVWRLVLAPGGYVSLQNNETGRYIFRKTNSEIATDSTAEGDRRWWRLTTNDDATQGFSIRTSDLPASAFSAFPGDDQPVLLSVETLWNLEDLSQGGTSVQEEAAAGLEIAADARSEDLPIVFLQAKDTAADGTLLVMQEFGGDTVRIREIDATEERQMWTVRFQKNGQALIQNVATLLYLAHFNDGVLRTAESEAGASRLFRIRHNNAGETTAIQALSNGNLNLNGILSGDPSMTGDVVSVAAPSSHGRQQWSFQPANASSRTR